MRPIRGVFCPLATPFDHNGKLYLSKLRHNVERLNKTTLAGYVAGSSAGEGALLREVERRRIFEEAAGAAESAKQLLADVSCDSVAAALELAGAAAEQGYFGIIARPPRGCAGDGLVARTRLFFQCLGDRSRLPVWIDLDRSSALGSPEALSLLQHPNVAGLLAKGSAVEALLNAGCEAEPLLGRREGELLDLWKRDVRAAILPLANAVPFFLLSVEEALRTRDIRAAEDLIARARPAFDEVYERLGVAGLKYAMDLRGYYGGAPRLPFSPLSPEEKQSVAATIEGLSS